MPYLNSNNFVFKTPPDNQCNSVFTGFDTSNQEVHKAIQFYDAPSCQIVTQEWRVEQDGSNTLLSETITADNTLAAYPFHPYIPSATSNGRWYVTPLYGYAPEEKSSLETEVSEKCIQSMKRGVIIFNDDEGDLAIAGSVQNEPHAAIDTAKCRHGTHKAPNENCRCGFYGVKDIDLLDETGNCTFMIELYGKIIEHKKGYRAEVQKVTSIVLDPCDSFRCRKRQTHGVALCLSLVDEESYTLCSECIHRIGGLEVFMADELTEMLGILVK